MARVGLVFLLELGPMVRLIRWRVASRRGEVVDTTGADGMAMVSYFQALLVVMIVGVAVGLARGL
jgi:putative membrane protein